MATINTGTVKELTTKEGQDLLDEQSRKYLGISGQEFLEKWETGEFDEDDRPEIMRLVMLIPFAK